MARPDDRASPTTLEFAELWGRHDVADHTSAVKAVDRPETGTLVFDATLLPLPELPGHHLIPCTTVPNQ